MNRLLAVTAAVQSLSYFRLTSAASSSFEQLKSSTAVGLQEAIQDRKVCEI